MKTTLTFSNQGPFLPTGSSLQALALTLSEYCSHRWYVSEDHNWDRIVINGGILPAKEMTMLDEQIIEHLSIDSDLYRETLNL